MNNTVLSCLIGIVTLGCLASAQGLTEAEAIALEPYATKPAITSGNYYSWNLVQNPGFEMGVEDWASIGSAAMAPSTTDPYSAIYSLAVTGRENPSDGVEQDVSAVVARKGAGDYWLGAAVRVASGTDTVALTVASDGGSFTVTGPVSNGWSYIHGVGTLGATGTVSTLTIATQSGSADLQVDEVLLRKAEDLSGYGFNYPSTYPVVQTFRMDDSDENSYFPIVYHMFKNGVLADNAGDPDKVCIGQSSWGAILNWGSLKTGDYPYANRGSFFPGWYTYFSGTDLAAIIGTGDTAITVIDPSKLLIAGNGNYYDAAIIARNPDGSPNWNKVEQVQVSSVTGSVATIVRGDCNSPVHAFNGADDAYIAQKPGWLSNHDTWMLNLSLVGPRDQATGMNGADFFAFYYEDFFTTERPYLDGIQFDVSEWVPGTWRHSDRVDIDNDGTVDGGMTNGVNVAGLGAQVAIRRMRENFGEDKLFTYDYESIDQARTTKYVDGASFEAALIEDYLVGREFAWLEGINEIIKERPIRYSYIQQVPNGGAPISDAIGRMGIAASAMLELPYVNEWNRTIDVVFWRDEYFGGEDINEQGWLGCAVGPIVRLNHFDPSSNLLVGAGWFLQTDSGYNASYSKNGELFTVDVTQTKGDTAGVRIASSFAVNQLNVDETYTLVFDARGDDDFSFGTNSFENVPRALELINSGARANSVNNLASVGENLTDTWRHYAISFAASGTTDTSRKLSFGVGEMTGQTQIRNVRLYKGSGHVMMREFENGMALLNASEYPHTFSLPPQLRRIDGLYTADVNDGRPVWGSVTVPAWDGLLLVKDESLPLGAPSGANPDGAIIYLSGLNPKIQRNFDVFSPCDFIAAITQHIPDKSFQLVRYYGWYSNKMRGQRDKHAAEDAAAAGQAVQIIDVSEHQPRRIPSAKWRELINPPSPEATADLREVLSICSLVRRSFSVGGSVRSARKRCASFLSSTSAT